MSNVFGIKTTIMQNLDVLHNSLKESFEFHNTHLCEEILAHVKNFIDQLPAQEREFSKQTLKKELGKTVVIEVLRVGKRLDDYEVLFQTDETMKGIS